jgi:hypothetical protein
LALTLLQALSQLVGQGLPLLWLDAPQTAVAHDLDRMVGQQHIQQHAGVVFGVPDPQLAKQLQRPFAHHRLALRAQRAQQPGPRQGGLDTQPHFSRAP